ncbi:MAG TPA: hypothetical protein VMR43_09300 [Variovorax sp.]|nr:hypothetical protein [Variovorax sp.]
MGALPRSAIFNGTMPGGQMGKRTDPRCPGAGAFPHWRSIGLGLLLLTLLPFFRCAWDFGWRGLTRDLTGVTSLHTSGGRRANAGVFAHKMLGALVVLLAPLQRISRVQARWSVLHRVVGCLLFLGSRQRPADSLWYPSIRTVASVRSSAEARSSKLPMAAGVL